MNPLITTVIPTFKRPHLLKRAIASVLEQDYENIEIYVYDNNSQDETRNIVEDFSKNDHRVKYFCHSENIGGLNNFLYGMSQVTGDYFSLLSDDDYLLPNFYKRAVSSLEKNKDAIFWAGMSLHIDANNQIWDARIARWPREGLFTPPEGFFLMTGGMAPAWTSILFRKKSIDLIGSIDVKTLGPSDLDYCLRLAAEYPYVIEKYPAAVFFLNSESYSATQPMSSFWPGWLRMIEKFSENELLEVDFRNEITKTLWKDAEKMLFRRGANALAIARFDFVNDAARALSMDCNKKLKANILIFLNRMCKKFPLLQMAYSRLYRFTELKIVESRKELQQQYRHLLK